MGTPDEVSQSLEDMMLQRFPELQPLLVQSSFTNKSAPWRPIKSGHTSHAASRATSLGVSREASFTHSRYTALACTCAALRCAVLCCAAMRCAVLRCAVLCCAVLPSHNTGLSLVTAMQHGPHVRSG